MWGDRVVWLGRPWFFVAIVVLAVNDHVLKQAHPGWTTGKLSDVAGVVVVGTVLAALLGATPGVVLTGVAFVALKTAPGAAELMAPLLGGLTLRDASDLVALLGLPVLWWWLRRERPDQPQRNRRGWQVIGLLAAVLATTATSQIPTRTVSLGSAAGAIYAVVDSGDAAFNDAYLTSADGGRTWSRVAKEAVESTPVEWDADEPGPEGLPQVCAADATCFRLVYDRAASAMTVERSVDGSQWGLDGVLSARSEYFEDLAVDTAASDRVVTLGPDRSVYYRQSGGDWVQVDLGPLADPPRWQRDLVTAMGSRIVVTVLFGLALLLSLWHAPPSGARWLLVLLNLLVGGYLWIMAMIAGPAGRLGVFGIWLLILAPIFGILRFASWLDGRPRRRPMSRRNPGTPSDGRGRG